MGVTFISKTGGVTAIGTIVLWFGNKADIPIGWEYYSAAAGYWVKGATSANTTPQNITDHAHAYDDDTGPAGSHTHPYSPTISQPINATTPGYYTGATKDEEWSDRYHTNHSKSITVSTAPDHIHDMLTTGVSPLRPPSVGLYYIRKT